MPSAPSNFRGRTPRFPQNSKDKSPPYYSSNNRQRLVGQVSSRGRGWLRSRIHRSEIIPYFGASASSTGTNKGQVFFLRRVPYIGLLYPRPPFRRGIRVRNGKRRGNVRAFFFPPHFSHYAATPHVLPRPRFVCIIL